MDYNKYFIEVMRWWNAEEIEICVWNKQVLNNSEINKDNNFDLLIRTPDWAKKINECRQMLNDYKEFDWCGDVVIGLINTITEMARIIRSMLNCYNGVFKLSPAREFDYFDLKKNN